MAIKTLTVDSVLDGWSSTDYVGEEGSYNSSCAIDPDYPRPSGTKTSGLIVPTRYEKFSGTELDGVPLWCLANSKTSNVLVYTGAGKIHSFDSALAMRTADEATTALPITITGGAGNGAVYYNNFYYLAEATDLSQYGPLSGGTIAKTENVWTGAKFSKTALTNTTYPSIRGIPIPNHPMHVHQDNSCYIGDVVSGQGVVHRLNTKKTTVEGDTDGTTVPSAFNALDLPFGYYPTDMESYGSGTTNGGDLVIAAIQSTNATINQGNAALFFWNPTDTDSFYRQVNLPDPLVTALLNVNGVLYIFSGNASSGMRISEYIGGETVNEIVYLEDGAPPFAGAVDAIGERLIWGSFSEYPVTSSSVYAFGSKRKGLPRALHNIARSTSSGANQIITALRVIQQASNITPRFIIGHGNGSAYGLDKLSTTATFNSVWRSKYFNINRKFKLTQLSIPLAGAVDANTSITVKIYLDDGSSSVTLPVINNTNYPSARKVVFDGADFSSALGENNFFIELTFAGTTQIPVLLPIEIEADINQDS